MVLRVELKAMSLFTKIFSLKNVSFLGRERKGCTKNILSMSGSLASNLGSDFSAPKGV